MFLYFIIFLITNNKKISRVLSRSAFSIISRWHCQIYNLFLMKGRERQKERVVSNLLRCARAINNSERRWAESCATTAVRNTYGNEQATEKEQAPSDPTWTAALRDGVQTAVRNGAAGRRRGRRYLHTGDRAGPRVWGECLRYPHNEGVGVSIKACGPGLYLPERPDLSETDLSSRRTRLPLCNARICVRVCLCVCMSHVYTHARCTARGRKATYAASRT